MEPAPTTCHDGQSFYIVAIECYFDDLTMESDAKHKVPKLFHTAVILHTWRASQSCRTLQLLIASCPSGCCNECAVTGLPMLQNSCIITIYPNSFQRIGKPSVTHLYSNVIEYNHNIVCKPADNSFNLHALLMRTRAMTARHDVHGRLFCSHKA
jgi:hypothetical protein